MAMGNALGLTFAPTGGAARGGAAVTGASQPVQRAIEVLRLRLPEMLGRQSIAPQALLSETATRQPSLNPATASVMQQIARMGSESVGAPSVASASVPTLRKRRPVQSVQAPAPSPIQRPVVDAPSDILSQVAALLGNASPMRPDIQFQGGRTSAPAPAPPVMPTVAPQPPPQPMPTVAPAPAPVAPSTPTLDADAFRKTFDPSLINVLGRLPFNIG